MTTNITIIEDALREINVIAETDTASAEQGSHGLRRLNQMMELWKEQSIDLGYFKQTSTTATIPIPDWAELAVTTALAVVMAPRYGASVSGELVAVVDSAVSTVKRKLIAEDLDNADMTHLPEGQGHWGNRYDIVTDN